MSTRPIKLILPIALLLAAGTHSASAASSIVECGQLVEYTAPDAGAPTTGSLGIGALDPWVIAADATISTAAAAALPSSEGGGPTCFALDLDDEGVVTALDFSATGRISGAVVFDATNEWYLFADRLILPTSVAAQLPGLAAIFVTSEAAGTDLTVDFDVDTTTGGFVGFDGSAAFCGPGSVGTDGEGLVGDASIPASVLDDDDRATLTDAEGAEVCAAVRSVGTIDPGNGNIEIETTVTIEPTAVATPEPTATPVPGAAEPTATGPSAAMTPPATSTMDVTYVGNTSGESVALAVIALVGAGALLLRPRRRNGTG